jgi:hypothetical protein
MSGIYGLYPDPETAQRAVDGLRAAGVREGDITVMSSEPLEDHEFAKRDEATWLPWIAAAGGAAGLSFGAWLTSMAQRAWPLDTGGMPIVTWWPNLIVTFETTMLGAIVATVLALLVTAGLPSRTSALYDPAISDGLILVGVRNAPGGSAADLERALQQAGAARVTTV